MKIVKLKKDNLEKAVRLAKKALENDQLAVIPSDTIYVLAAKATSSVGVKKLLDFKGRRFQKGISVFLESVEKIKKYAVYDQNQERIIKTLLPGYFTVVLESKKQTAPEIEPGDDTIGIRIIDHFFVNLLTEMVNFPITATSANISGKGPHYSVASFLNTLSVKKKKALSLLIDAGKLPPRPTSTVVRLVADRMEILRRGALNPVLIAQFQTKSSEETKKIAQKIYQSFWKKSLANQAVLVILRGDLGSGKTVFAQGIGERFNRRFISPTFVLLDEHPISQPPLENIYHLDLYRIESEEEILNLKLENFLKKGNLMMIEWGEKLSTFEKLKRPNVTFFFLQIEVMGEKIRGLKLFQV